MNNESNEQLLFTGGDSCIVMPMNLIYNNNSQFTVKTSKDIN